MMQQSDPDHSIYAVAVACSDLFDLYLKSPRTAETRRDVAAELLGRFNLWAAYVGAFALPKASLDARLADHDDVRDMVLELLAMIQRNITQGKNALASSGSAWWRWWLLTSSQNCARATPNPHWIPSLWNRARAIYPSC